MRLGDTFILIPILGVAAAPLIEGWSVIVGVVVWAGLYFGACFLMEWFVHRGKW